jgi:N-acyl homoserine lactone hydrolase
MRPATLTFACAAALALSMAAPAAFAQAGKSGIERLYILDCGHGHAPDQSRWTPGLNVGKPIDLLDNCYLIKHTQGWMMWDTGIADSIAALPGGQPSADPRGIHWSRPKTLASQLAELNVKPSDIKYVAVSHTHADHIGNIEMFPTAMLFVQKEEYEWPGPGNTPRFKPEHPVTKLEGDRDIFGDGSVTVIRTLGHTPGHQSLLVRLPKTGAILLSGDAVHSTENWEHRYVPEQNTSKELTLASMQHMADLIAKEKAQLWINHDAPQGNQVRRSPEFYE